MFTHLRWDYQRKELIQLQLPFFIKGVLENILKIIHVFMLLKLH
jgi:hypothetical protein